MISLYRYPTWKIAAHNIYLTRPLFEILRSKCMDLEQSPTLQNTMLFISPEIRLQAVIEVLMFAIPLVLSTAGLKVLQYIRNYSKKLNLGVSRSEPLEVRINIHLALTYDGLMHQTNFFQQA